MTNIPEFGGSAPPRRVKKFGGHSATDYNLIGPDGQPINVRPEPRVPRRKKVVRKKSAPKKSSSKKQIRSNLPGDKAETEIAAKPKDPLEGYLPRQRETIYQLGFIPEYMKDKQGTRIGMSTSER